jgi:hypothetical protein
VSSEKRINHTGQSVTGDAKEKLRLALCQDERDVVVLICGIQAADFFGDGFESRLAGPMPISTQAFN